MKGIWCKNPCWPRRQEESWKYLILIKRNHYLSVFVAGENKAHTWSGCLSITGWQTTTELCVWLSVSLWWTSIAGWWTTAHLESACLWTLVRNPKVPWSETKHGKGTKTCMLCKQHANNQISFLMHYCAILRVEAPREGRSEVQHIILLKQLPVHTQSHHLPPSANKLKMHKSH